MKKQQYSLAEALEGFGKCYDVAHSIWVERVGLPSEHKELLQSVMNSLLYFTRYAHERAGRNPICQICPQLGPCLPLHLRQTDIVPRIHHIPCSQKPSMTTPHILTRHYR